MPVIRKVIKDIEKSLILEDGADFEAENNGGDTTLAMVRGKIIIIFFNFTENYFFLQRLL